MKLVRLRGISKDDPVAEGAAGFALADTADAVVGSGGIISH